MNAVDRFLGQVGGVRRSGDGYAARCPAHDDRNASLSVGVGDDGRVLVKCHAGCTAEEITAAVGLTIADLFERPSGERESGSGIAATYDYEDERGELLFQVVRFEPKRFAQRRPDGDGGWIWKLDDTRRVLYRLPHVLGAVAAGRGVFVVEGEKDVDALTAAGEVATCNPMGAGKWRDEYSTALARADVTIVRDRDEEGRKHAAAVAASLAGVANSIRVVEPAEGKDAADHLAAGRDVREFVGVADTVASEASESPSLGAEDASASEIVAQAGDPRPVREPPPLAAEPDILALFRRDLGLAGVAGEERLACLIYLAVTSRVLEWGKPSNRPVSLIAKGTTSSGKSHTLQTTLEFFPRDAYIDLGSMSKRYLLYMDEGLEHRFIVVPEWSGVAGDEDIVTALRTLLSEGRLTHGTVDGDARRSPRRIEKDGPTGLLMTTTAASVDAELETRMLSVLTDDSPDQTRRVFEALADLEDEERSPVDFASWHDLQSWLAESGEHRVRIPYVRALARLMPTGSTRLRGDFVSIVCLVRAHAILHQGTRERDSDGRIIATIADYAAVRDLVADIVAESAGAAAPTAIRETVDAARTLLADAADHTTVRALADKLGIGLPATYDRVRRALEAGYLVDVAARQEKTKKLRLGAALPGDGDFLPPPDDILGALSEDRTEYANSVASPDLPVESARQESRIDARLADGQIVCATCGTNSAVSSGGCNACAATTEAEAPLERKVAEDAAVANSNGPPAPLPGDLGYRAFVYERYRSGALTRPEWLQLIFLDGALRRAPDTRAPATEVPRHDLGQFYAIVAPPRAKPAAALCRYPEHRGRDWPTRDGRLICGTCHPPATPNVVAPRAPAPTQSTTRRATPRAPSARRTRDD